MMYSYALLRTMLFRINMDTGDVWFIHIETDDMTNLMSAEDDDDFYARCKSMWNEKSGDVPSIGKLIIGVAPKFLFDAEKFSFSKGHEE